MNEDIKQIREALSLILQHHNTNWTFGRPSEQKYYLGKDERQSLKGALAVINKVGVRGFRAVIEKNTSSRTWQRIVKELRETQIENNIRFKAIVNVENALNEFRPLKLKDYVVN